MKLQTAGWMTRLVKKVYAFCLHAYPNAYWQTYGTEMAEVFGDLADDTALQGTAALLGLSLSEFWHTFVAILHAYWTDRNRVLLSSKRIMFSAFQALLRRVPPDAEDGRTAWSQAVFECTLFSIWGIGLILMTYLLNPLIRLFDPLAFLILILPLLWTLVGFARGTPRWAYPGFGILFGYSLFASLAGNVLPLFIAFLCLAVSILVWSYHVDRKKPFLPEWLRDLRNSLIADPTRLSFGMYGLVVPGVILAFDNAYQNNSTLWLLVSVLCMICGAACYSRSVNSLMQIGSLAAGMTLTLLAALLDHSHFTGLHWPGPLWIYLLWVNLLGLILMPTGLNIILRLFHDRRNRKYEERSTPGA